MAYSSLCWSVDHALLTLHLVQPPAGLRGGFKLKKIKDMGKAMLEKTIRQKHRIMGTQGTVPEPVKRPTPANHLKVARRSFDKVLCWRYFVRVNWAVIVRN